MLKIRLWGFASVLCRVWALFVGVLSAQAMLQRNYGLAIIKGLVFALAWHASELAKQQSFDLLAKADNRNANQFKQVEP